MAPDKSLNLMVLPIAHLEKCNNYKIKKKKPTRIPLPQWQKEIPELLTTETEDILGCQ